MKTFEGSQFSGLAKLKEMGDQLRSAESPQAFLIALKKVMSMYARACVAIFAIYTPLMALGAGLIHVNGFKLGFTVYLIWFIAVTLYLIWYAGKKAFFWMFIDGGPGAEAVNNAESFSEEEAEELRRELEQDLARYSENSALFFFLLE